jgi:hypothetical protein
MELDAGLYLLAGRFHAAVCRRDISCHDRTQGLVPCWEEALRYKFLIEPSAPCHRP